MRLGAAVGSVTGTGVGAVAGTVVGKPMEGAAEGAKMGAVSGAVAGSLVDEVVLSPVTLPSKLLSKDPHRTCLTIDDIIEMKEKQKADDATLIHQIESYKMREQLTSRDAIKLADHEISADVIVAIQNNGPALAPSEGNDVMPQVQDERNPFYDAKTGTVLAGDETEQQEASEKNKPIYWGDANRPSDHDPYRSLRQENPLLQGDFNPAIGARPGPAPSGY